MPSRRTVAVERVTVMPSRPSLRSGSYQAGDQHGLAGARSAAATRPAGGRASCQERGAEHARLQVRRGRQRAAELLVDHDEVQRAQPAARRAPRRTRRPARSSARARATARVENPSGLSSSSRTMSGERVLAEQLAQRRAQQLLLLGEVQVHARAPLGLPVGAAAAPGVVVGAARAAAMRAVHSVATSSPTLTVTARSTQRTPCGRRRPR